MDAFRSLTTGARFDRSKASVAAAVFAPKGADKTTSSSAADLVADLFGKVLDKKDKVKEKKTEDAKEISQVVEESDSKKSIKKSKSKAMKAANAAKVTAEGGDTRTEEEINAFRNRLQIKVKGEGVANPEPTFASMLISQEMKAALLKNIEASYWKEPTPIQMQAIPVQLQNRDILAAAPTGSGKAAAYTIPLLSKLATALESDTAVPGLKALILAPTKELADQIDREVNRLKEGKKIKICNLRKPIVQQALRTEGKAVFAKFDVLIATPMRLVSVVRAGAIDLSGVHTIVLDEADKLLELDSLQIRRNAAEERKEARQQGKGKGNQAAIKGTKRARDVDVGDDRDSESDANSAVSKEADDKRERSAFLQQVDEVLAEIPASQHVQRVLFSATLGPFVLELAKGFLKNPIHVVIGTENAGASTVEQRLTFVGREDGKLLAMRQLVQQGLRPPVLVFVQSVPRAKELHRELIYDGINVDVMHAERSAAQRDDVIRRFRVGEIWVLICTDLMARGIDFSNVQMVVNYDLPLSAVSYIHRIGRSGRAGRKGSAVTFFTEQDIPRLRPIANVIRLSGGEVPDWMLNIKSMSTRNKRQLRQSAPKRRKISTRDSVGGEDS